MFFCGSLPSPCCVRWRLVRARARHCCARTILDRGRGGMRVAITLCGQPKRERRKDENDDALFCWSEAESLPHFIESKTPVVFNHE